MMSIDFRKYKITKIAMDRHGKTVYIETEDETYCASIEYADIEKQDDLKIDDVIWMIIYVDSFRTQQRIFVHEGFIGQIMEGLFKCFGQ